ncbi:hypothetical protein HBI24_162980 [Parastagonospora nodorum]|nr:hypothetical protein HBI24_162980 [Parastagonospora nodorum]
MPNDANFKVLIPPHARPQQGPARNTSLICMARLRHNTRLRHMYLYAKLKPALKIRSHISSKISVSQTFYTRLVLDSS